MLTDLTRFARAEEFRIHTHLAESEFEDASDREDLAERLLAAATVRGAKAMGMDHPDGGVGVLEPGRAADFAVFVVQPDLGSSVEALVTSGAGRCIATCIAGQVRFDADSG